MTCKPILSPKQAAEFLSNCFTREYRVKCLEHWRKRHGDDYADRVKAAVEAIFSKRKVKR